MRKVSKNYFRCDKCGKEVEYGDIKNPNEMTTANGCWTFRPDGGQAGYGSQFDGSYVDFDICDSCLGEVFKTFKFANEILNSGSNEYYDGDNDESDEKLTYDEFRDRYDYAP